MDGMKAPAVYAIGMFGSEDGQRFLQILVAFGCRGFGGLYEKCMRNIAGNYYQKGLRRVCEWPDDIIREDIDFVEGKFPSLARTIETCFCAYIHDRSHSSKAAVTCPPMVAIVRAFLERLGEHDTLVSGQFFERRDPLVQRFACMDAAREAFFGLSRAQVLPDVELASQVSAEKSVVRPLSEATHRDFVEADVRPQDSISQVSVNPDRRPAPPQGAPSAAGRARPSDGADAVRSVKQHEAPRQASEVARTRPPSEVARQPTDRFEQPARERRAESVVSRHDFEEPVLVPVLPPSPVRSSRGTDIGMKQTIPTSP